MGAHLIDGEFQSDKYPTCPRGKVPLSVKDRTAQDLLWQYAQRRRAVDPEFSSDLESALRAAGYSPCSVCGYAGDDPTRRCAICAQLGDADAKAPNQCGDVCASDPGGEAPCVLPKDHEGSHKDKDRRTWARPRWSHG